MRSLTTASGGNSASPHVVSYAAGFWGLDVVTATAVKVNLDIARKEGAVVTEAQEAINGSLVQIVPRLNPSGLHPSGIFLNLPKVEIEPAWMASRLTLRVQKSISGFGNGYVRVYREGQLFMDELDTDKLLPAADLAGAWKVDSTFGGIADLLLVAFLPNGAEGARDTVRISSTPGEPDSGRIIFVNPSSAGPAAPYRNPFATAAHSVADAVAVMTDHDNILFVRGTHSAVGTTISKAGFFGGLGGRWLRDDPTLAVPPTTTPPIRADDAVFDFASVPVIDGTLAINATSGAYVPMFSAGSTISGKLAFAGLQMINGKVGVTDDVGGGALFVSDFTNPLRLEYCKFSGNRGTFGGAVFLNSASDAKIDTCQFSGNRAEFYDGGNAVCDKGMGGAIASKESTLEVAHCVFSANSARVTTGGDTPAAGSAGGGGDLYMKNGTLRFLNCISTGAKAGRPKPPGDLNPNQFTGDGGSILVHGETIGTAVTISDSIFSGSISYGNGGAISFSKDSSVEGRQYFVGPSLSWPPFSTHPAELDGACQSSLARLTFRSCEGGWQGGAISVNGRRMNIIVSDAVFLDCIAGATHLRDGKAGALSVCGGLQQNAPPVNSVNINNATVRRCSASGNGGAFYSTIRGNLKLDSCDIMACSALNQWATPITAGMGGGVHVSAGGVVEISGQTRILFCNAAVSGGGLSVKSGRCLIVGPVSIEDNSATAGNGGGLFVTTSYFDDAVGDAGWGAATLYGAHGDVTSGATGGTLSVLNNAASRWGGGVYVGISPLIYVQPNSDKRDAAWVSLNMATITGNRCSGLAVNSPPNLPAQIAAEFVASGNMTSAGLSFSGCTIAGALPSRDIGIYWFNSIDPATNGVIYAASTLIHPITKETP